jgi:hypothetical protein
MRPACLVIRRASVPYIRRVAEALRDDLSSHFGPATTMVICDEIDEAAIGDAGTVFLVGEEFGPFLRRAGCRYVYVNFSVVAVLGNPLAMSVEGWRRIRWKQRLLARHATLCDAVLDYYPAQTRVLRRILPRPVHGFLPHVGAPAMAALRPPDQRAHDVCFVGGITPRRQAVLDSLVARGLSFTPARGELEDLAADARVTLNIHMQRSNHFEIPRVVGAMAAGSVVVTETSHGIGDVVPEALVCVARYGRLAGALAALVQDPGRLAALQGRALDWYAQVHVPRCRTLLRESLDAVTALAPRRDLS